MIIENAERFGLAELHQLRGRVGRSGHQSYCYLVNYSRSETAIDRANAMVRISDGFEISEEDYLVNTLGYDSIGLYNLIVACSEYFDIQIQIAQALLASTEQKVGEFITMIHNYCIQEAARHNNQ